MRKSSETRLTRRGVYVVALAAALGGCGVTAAADRLLVKDYGCGVATVGKDSDAITAAQRATAQVAPLDGSLHRLVIDQVHATTGSGNVQPGEQVTACVTADPLLGAGDGGWVLNLRITDPVTNG